MHIALFTMLHKCWRLLFFAFEIGDFTITGHVYLQEKSFLISSIKAYIFSYAFKTTVKLCYNEQNFQSQITIYYTNIPGYNEPRQEQTNLVSPELFAITKFNWTYLKWLYRYYIVYISGSQPFWARDTLIWFENFGSTPMSN